MGTDSKAMWGAIFDFDGVIVDTEWHHEVCWKQVAQERSQPITHEQYVAGFGLKNERFIAEILAWTTELEEIKKIAKRKEEIFQNHAATNKIDLVEGVYDFIQMLAKHGVPCAIASSSILKNIEIVLAQSPVKRYFGSIISGESVKHGKPHPECFLTAAQKLEKNASQCVVFEDALLGVEAAKRAGCKVVAITTTFSRQEFENYAYQADLIVDHFQEIKVAKIDSWFSEN